MSILVPVLLVVVVFLQLSAEWGIIVSSRSNRKTFIEKTDYS